VKRAWPLLLLAGIVVLLFGVFSMLDDDPIDLAHTDAADRARAEAAQQAHDELVAVLGDREPVATTHEDTCVVEEISNDADFWTTGPQQLRCTYTGAVVALLPVSTEAEAAALAQRMLGDRCEVPATAARVERTGCAGGLWYAVVAADSSGEVLSAGLGGAGGTTVSAGEPFDGGELVRRAREVGAEYLLWLESMNGYLEAPLDQDEPDPEPERVLTCQEHSGYPNTCPGG